MFHLWFNRRNSDNRFFARANLGKKSDNCYIFTAFSPFEAAVFLVLLLFGSKII